MAYLIILLTIFVIFVIVIIFQWVYLPKIYFETIFHSRWMSVTHHIISLFLLFITLGLAIVNYKTYLKIAEYNVETIDNYKIRNRPFVKIEPRSIIKKKKMINVATKELNTPFSPQFKLINFGQFPAFIERIDIWIEDEPKDLLMPKGSGDLNIENFALFQGEKATISKWRFLLGDSDTKKNKENKK